MKNEISCYSRIGTKPIINASGHNTKLGGSLMPKEVREAMLEAGERFVDLTELQSMVAEQIAKLTRNEAAYVSAGAASGLFLSAAACMTGTNLAKIGRLPDTKGMKNEIIIHRSHRNPYELVILPTGAKIVDIGFANQTDTWQLESAINENTAAVFYFYFRGGPGNSSSALSLEQVIEIAHRRGVPVVLDAAAQLPPPENLWRYTELGVDLVIFSGGKELQGPQETGLILGKKTLIEACRLIGSPHYTLGRMMKVSKEGTVGLLVALERYLSLDHEAIKKEREAMASDLIAKLSGLPGVSVRKVWPDQSGRPITTCELRLVGAVNSGTMRNELLQRLRAWDPPIVVSASGPDALVITPQTLRRGEEVIIIKAISTLLPTLSS